MTKLSKRVLFSGLAAAGVALASLGVASLPASAALPPMANPDPAAVQPGSYAVETHHTRITFIVTHFGFTDYNGDFTDAHGTLVIDPKNPAADKLDITIPTASVFTTNSVLDAELKGADWFDAAQYPTITFHSTHVNVTAPGKAEVVGDLTFHGVTKPVALMVKFNAGGVNPMNKHYTLGFNAMGEIKRSDFGVTKYVPVVSDEVRLHISAAFEKQD